MKAAATVRNGAGGTVSLLREERGQKERDERTCVRVKRQVGCLTSPAD